MVRLSSRRAARGKERGQPRQMHSFPNTVSCTQRPAVPAVARRRNYRGNAAPGEVGLLHSEVLSTQVAVGVEKAAGDMTLRSQVAGTAVAGARTDCSRLR
jgi:hypothetical protein